MGVFLEKARDVSRTAIITHRYHPHPPPPLLPPIPTKKNAFPDGGIDVILSER